MSEVIREHEPAQDNEDLTKANSELAKAVRVLLSYLGERVVPTEPAAAEHLGRKITQRIIEAIGSTGQPESAEDALTRLLAALMEAQAARGRAEGQLIQQQDAQLRQEQDVVTDLRNKKGAGHERLSAQSQVGARVQHSITGRWGTVMEVQGFRTLVRWDGLIKPDESENAGEESDRRPDCMCGTGVECQLPEHIAAKANSSAHDDDAHGPAEECPDCIEGRHST